MSRYCATSDGSIECPADAKQPEYEFDQLLFLPCFRLRSASGGEKQNRLGRDNNNNDGIFSDIWPLNNNNGTAEALIRVLNAKRSPLSFQLQPLVLHVSPANVSEERLIASDVVLVLRSEVIYSHQPRQEATAPMHTDRRRSGIPDISREETQPSEHEEGATKLVVEEQELGRSLPFTVHSTITVLSAAITIPSNALVEDLPRFRGSGDSGMPRSLECGGGGTATDVAPVKRRVVAELVQDASFQDCARRGSIYGKLSVFTRKVDAIESDGVTNNENRVASVLARAYLEPEFLRRTVGNQRSIALIAPPPEEKIENESRRKRGESENTGCFARLEIAGHVIAARPARPCLRLEVLECQNLAKADLIGKSDPCVLIFWDGEEVGRTPIACNDLNPVFASPRNTFRLPFSPAETEANITSTTSSRSHRTMDWQNYVPELRLEVWDMDRETLSRQWKKGEFLGSTTLRGPCDMVPLLLASGATNSSDAGGRRQSTTERGWGRRVCGASSIASLCIITYAAPGPKRDGFCTVRDIEHRGM